METLLVIMMNIGNRGLRFFIIIYILGTLFYLPLETLRKIEQLRNINLERGDILIRNLRNRMEFLQTVLNDFREMEGIESYSKEEENNPYIVTELFNQIKKKNNFYGKLGYEISLLKSGEERVITPEGTYSSKEFLTKLGFLEKGDIGNSNNLKNLSIIFKDRNYLQEGNINWIVTIDKKVFFSELNLSGSGAWYLKKGEEYFSLGYKNEKELEKIRKISMRDRVEDFLVEDYTGDISIYPDIGNQLSFIYLHPIHPYKEIFFIEFLKLFSLFILVLILKKVLEKIHGNYQEKLSEIENIADTFGYEISEPLKDEEGIKDKIKYIRDQMLELKKDNSQNLLRDFILGVNQKEPKDENIKTIFSNENRVLLIQVSDFEMEYDFENFILGKNFIKEQKKFFKIVDLDYKSFLLIVEENRIEEASILSEDIIKTFQEKFQVKIVVGISKVFKGLRELPKLYREVKKFLEYGFAIKDSGVVSEEKLLQIGKISNYYYSLDLEAKLVSKTLSGNIIGVKKLINEIFEDKIDTKVLNSEKCKEFSKQIYNTLERIVSMLKDFHSEKTIQCIETKKINNVENIEDIKTIFTNILMDICKITKTEEQSDSEIVKVKIQSYMEDNYMRDISLENLADYLGHSFKYTSILFKKIMGENFKNYLDLYRIEKSKELMEKDKSLKIKDIAEMVGCNSSNTFIRMFRRYTGTSPGRYSGVEE